MAKLQRNEPKSPKVTESASELTDAELEMVIGGGKASPVLMSACCKGTHLPEVTIEL